MKSICNSNSNLYVEQIFIQNKTAQIARKIKLKRSTNDAKVRKKNYLIIIIINNQFIMIFIYSITFEK